MMRHRRFLPTLVFAVALASCDRVSPDGITGPNAETAPKPQVTAIQPGILTGESFVATTVEVSGACAADGTGTFTFTATGAAAGPYPGTFIERGSIELLGNGTGFFNAEFTINSTIQIQGNKFLATPISASCVGSAVTVPNQGVQYRANVDGFADQGFAFVDLFSVGGTGQGVFRETFISMNDPMLVVTLDPPAAENPVGTSHTVTATVVAAPSMRPAEGVLVIFEVTSATGGVYATGQCTTDANGQCSFTYQGPHDVDVHTIEACAQHPSIATVCGVATKVFFLPPSTPGHCTGGGHILHKGKVNGVSFGFTGKFDPLRGHHGKGSVVDHVTKTRIKLLDVTHLLVTGTHATIRGNAEVNGVPTGYTIDIDDIGEPGMGRDMFKIVTDNGYEASGVLTGGNIQIHQ